MDKHLADGRRAAHLRATWHPLARPCLLAACATAVTLLAAPASARVFTQWDGGLNISCTQSLYGLPCVNGSVRSGDSGFSPAGGALNGHAEIDSDYVMDVFGHLDPRHLSTQWSASVAEGMLRASSFSAFVMPVDSVRNPSEDVGSLAEARFADTWLIHGPSVGTRRISAHFSLGGAIGDLAAWGEAGPALRAALARELGLEDPGDTWHTLRAPWLALASDAALAAGTMTKIAHDVGLGAMAEIGELREPHAPGRGGSSAMPHKRNPVLSMRIIAATQPLPGMMAGLLHGMQQEQERALGNWQAEIGQVPELLTRVCAAATVLRELLAGLQVDAGRCRRNIEALHGTVFSEPLAALLIPALGRADAQALVAALCQEALQAGVDLRDLIRQSPDARLAAIPADQLAAVFDLDRAAAASQRLVAPLVARAETLLQDAKPA